MSRDLKSLATFMRPPGGVRRRRLCRDGTLALRSADDNRPRRRRQRNRYGVPTGTVTKAENERPSSLPKLPEKRSAVILARGKRPLRPSELKRRYHSLVTAARRCFGSWPKAIVAAGVQGRFRLRPGGGARPDRDRVGRRRNSVPVVVTSPNYGILRARAWAVPVVPDANSWRHGWRSGTRRN